MKVIKMKNTILSLENVKTVTFHEGGTGSQRDPYRCWVHVEYMNGETANGPSVQGEDNRATVAGWFDDIFALLALD